MTVTAPAAVSTELLSTAWTWKCRGQDPVVVATSEGPRRIKPNRITVTRHSDATVHVMVEGPGMSAGKPRGKHLAGALDPASATCPRWVRYLFAGLTGESCAGDR